MAQEVLGVSNSPLSSDGNCAVDGRELSVYMCLRSNVQTMMYQFACMLLTSGLPISCRNDDKHSTWKSNLKLLAWMVTDACNMA